MRRTRHCVHGKERGNGAEQVHVKQGHTTRFDWGIEGSPVHSKPFLVCLSAFYRGKNELRGVRG